MQLEYRLSSSFKNLITTEGLKSRAWSPTLFLIITLANVSINWITSSSEWV
jgi:hypothetical protein